MSIFFVYAVQLKCFFYFFSFAFSILPFVCAAIDNLIVFHHWTQWIQNISSYFALLSVCVWQQSSCKRFERKAFTKCPIHVLFIRNIYIEIKPRIDFTFHFTLLVHFFCCYLHLISSSHHSALSRRALFMRSTRIDRQVNDLRESCVFRFLLFRTLLSPTPMAFHFIHCFWRQIKWNKESSERFTYT